MAEVLWIASPNGHSVNFTVTRTNISLYSNCKRNCKKSYFIVGHGIVSHSIPMVSLYCIMVKFQSEFYMKHRFRGNLTIVGDWLCLLFLFFRQGLITLPWLNWNLLFWPNCPQTHRDPFCLCLLKASRPPHLTVFSWLALAQHCSWGECMLLPAGSPFLSLALVFYCVDTLQSLSRSSLLGMGI